MNRNKKNIEYDTEDELEFDTKDEVDILPFNISKENLININELDYKIPLTIMDDVSAYFEACSETKRVATKEGLALFLGISSKLLTRISTPKNFKTQSQFKLSKQLEYALEMLEDAMIEKTLQGGLDKTYSDKVALRIISKRYKDEKDSDDTAKNITNNFLVSIRQELGDKIIKNVNEKSS